MVLVEDDHLEQAERGETELALIAVDYTGPRSAKPVDTLQSQAYWPGYSPLVSSTRYVALVPDEGLGYLEATNDLDVYYDKEKIARGLLSRNYLPKNVFGRRMDNRVQERVIDTLGIEFQGIENEEANREELRSVANVDEKAEGEPEEASNPRVEELVDEYKRTELLSAAADLGMDGATSKKKRELAEYLADQDQDDVHSQLEGDESEDIDSEESEE